MTLMLEIEFSADHLRLMVGSHIISHLLENHVQKKMLQSSSRKTQINSINGMILFYVKTDVDPEKQILTEIQTCLQVSALQ